MPIHMLVMDQRGRGQTRAVGQDREGGQSTHALWL
jgi:hypothetical protein